MRNGYLNVKSAFGIEVRIEKEKFVAYHVCVAILKDVKRIF